MCGPCSPPPHFPSSLLSNITSLESPPSSTTLGFLMSHFPGPKQAPSASVPAIVARNKRLPFPAFPIRPASPGLPRCHIFCCGPNLSFLCSDTLPCQVTGCPAALILPSLPQRSGNETLFNWQCTSVKTFSNECKLNSLHACLVPPTCPVKAASYFQPVHFVRLLYTCTSVLLVVPIFLALERCKAICGDRKSVV